MMLLTRLDPKSHESILDLGCGTGELAYEIAKKGTEVIGIDIDYYQIEKAKKHKLHDSLNVNFQEMNATQLSFTEKFDAVVSHRLIHWVDEEQQKDLLDNVWQALKPGGRFVASLFGAGTGDEIINIIKNTDIKKQHYLRWYLPEIDCYKRLLSESGFESIQVEEEPEMETRYAYDFFEELILDEFHDYFKVFVSIQVLGLTNPSMLS